MGGLFFVDSPEQRRLRIRDSRELALQDWLGSAQFDRPEDDWPRKVAAALGDPRRTPDVPLAKYAPGFIHRECVGFRLSAGRNAAGRWRMDMATRFHVSISPGALGQVSLSLSNGACAGMLRVAGLH